MTIIFVLEHQTLEIVRIGGNPREIFDNELVEPIHADMSYPAKRTVSFADACATIIEVADLRTFSVLVGERKSHGRAAFFALHKPGEKGIVVNLAVLYLFPVKPLNRSKKLIGDYRRMFTLINLAMIRNLADVNDIFENMGYSIQIKRLSFAACYTL